MPPLTDYQTLHTLFPRQAQTDIILNAVIAGTTPAKVIVDDVHRPQAALIWLHSDVILMGGHPGLPFTEEAAALINTLRKQGRRAFMAIPTSTNWDNLQSIFEGFGLVEDTRLLLRLDTPQTPRTTPAVQVSIQPIDANLLCQVCYEHMHYLSDDIDTTWPSQDAFLDKGFGFAALAGSTLMGWCTAEYLSDNTCAISIETMEEFQNQGIATLNAAAFAQEAARRGLTAYWDCWADFTICRRLAEKVGFRTVTRYPVTVASV